jgi:hypothetical protein
MKKNIKHFICLNFLLLITFNSVIGQSLEQILERHYEAVGAKNIGNIQSIQYKGKFENSYLKNFIESTNIDKKFLAPEFVLSVINKSEYLLQIDGYFKEEAYAYSESNYWRDQGGIPPEQWIPSNIERLKIQLFLDIEGFLYHWNEKGFMLKKQDDVAIENNNYHRLRLITPEKDTLFYYLNPENYLISKISFFWDLTEKTDSPSYTYTNYKKVKGFHFPFNRIYKTQMFKGPNGYQDMIIDQIKLNPKLNKEIFSLKIRSTKISN